MLEETAEEKLLFQEEATLLVDNQRVPVPWHSEA